MKDYLPLIVGGVSAVTVVIAAFLGAWLGRRNEHARWLREQRLLVYSEWLGVVVEDLFVVSLIRDVQRDNSSLRSEYKAFLNEIRNLESLTSGVQRDNSSLQSETDDLLDEFQNLHRPSKMSASQDNRLKQRFLEMQERLTHSEQTMLDEEKNRRRLTLQRNVLFSRLQILASPTVRTGAITLRNAASLAMDSNDPIRSKDWRTAVSEFETLIRAELGLG